MTFIYKMNRYFFGSHKIHPQDALFFYGGLLVPVLMCVYIAFRN